MSKIYVVLPRLEVEAANASSSGVTINATPVMSAVLFGHALGRHVDSYVSRVGYIHHDAQHLGEKLTSHPYSPQQRRGASFIDKNDYASSNKHALSLQPTASFHLCVSLIFEFDEIDADFGNTDIESFLLGGRFAGGKIVNFASPRFCNKQDLESHLPSGFWVIDRTDLVNTENPLSMLPLLSQNEEGTNQHSWLVLTNLGYALTSQPSDKPFSRSGYPHAFSEPLIGPVQYVSTRGYRKETSSIPFWSYEWVKEDIFIIHQRSNSE